MKKKLVAIILSALLVVSALLVLTACQPKQENNEYEIVFRNYNSMRIFSLTTVDGKITEEMVNDAMKENPPKRAGDGWSFVGWYETIKTDDDGNLIYEKPINYTKTYTENFSYYAKFENLVSEGLPQGYNILGVIGGYTNWNWGWGDGSDWSEDLATPAEWKLKQHEDEGWLYSTTVDIVGGDQIKVKESTAGWHDDICNLGWDGFGEATLGTGVQLPEGIEAYEDGGSAESAVFFGSGTGNVFVSGHVSKGNITVTYNARTNKFSVVINSLEWKDVVKPVSYILVGSLKEANWDANWTADDHVDIAALVFGTVGEKDEYTLTYTFRAGDEFKVATNDNQWNPEWNFGCIAETKSSTGVSIDGIITDNNGNIKVNQACTVTITIKVSDTSMVIDITALA